MLIVRINFEGTELMIALLEDAWVDCENAWVRQDV